MFSPDLESIDAWCRELLGAGVADRLFTGGHLGAVVGVELTDGRQVVLKIRPASPRLAAVAFVQSRLWAAGVPCPRPVAGPLPFQGQAITAETYVPADPAPTTGVPAEASATLLAAVLAAAPVPSTVTALDPAPPWVGWDHGDNRMWPPPDDLDVDLNDQEDGDWLDDAALRVRTALRGDAAPRVVGHADWEAQNLGWRDGLPIVAYDWDSLAIRTEATIVGAAATVFASTTGESIAASIAQTEAFLEAFQRARRPLQPGELRASWAAGLWTLLYNAKKELAGGGRGYVRHLQDELADRMRRAGL